MHKTPQKDALPTQWDGESLEDHIANSPIYSMQAMESATRRIKAAQGLLETTDNDVADQQAYVHQVLKALAELRNAVTYDIRLLTMNANKGLGMSAASLAQSANISDRTLPNWHEKGWELYGDPDYSEYAQESNQ